MYKKYNSNDVWLEYDSVTGEWLVKPTECKGGVDSDCYAYSSCDYGTLPERVPSGTWIVKAEEGFGDSNDYESQPNTVVSLV